MYSNLPMKYPYHTPSYHPWSIPPTYPTNPTFTTTTTPSFPSFPWELFTPCYTHGSSSPKLYLNHGYSPHQLPNPYSSSPCSYYYHPYHQQIQPTKISSTIRRDFEKSLQVSLPCLKKRSKKISQKTLLPTSHYLQKPKISYPNLEIIKNLPPPLKPPDITGSQSPQPSSRKPIRSLTPLSTFRKLPSLSSNHNTNSSNPNNPFMASNSKPIGKFSQSMNLSRAPLTLDDFDSVFGLSSDATLSTRSDLEAQSYYAYQEEDAEANCFKLEEELSPLVQLPLRVTPFAHLSTYDDKDENEETMKTQDERRNLQQQLVSLTSVNFDSDLYDANDRDSYNTSISANKDEEILESVGNEAPCRIALIARHKSHFIDMPSDDTNNDGVDGGIRFRKPQRHGALAAGKKMSDPSERTYVDIMRKEALKKEQEETLREILILNCSIEIPKKYVVNTLGLLLQKVEGVPLLLVMDEVLWATIVAGYEQHGCYFEVLELIDKVQHKNNALNLATEEMDGSAKGIYNTSLPLVVKIVKNVVLDLFMVDLPGSMQLKRSLQERILKTLSNMRTPSYIGEVICTDVNTGNVPPCIVGMRVLPMEVSEVWALEVDIEYSGGTILEIEKRLEAYKFELQTKTGGANSEPNNVGHVLSDLEGFEYLEKQLKLEGRDNDFQEQNEDGNWNNDASKSFKRTVSSSNDGPRWISVLNFVAKQVPQVPLSLAIKVASLKGMLCLHIKPPLSDQLCYGFTSVPNIYFNNLKSSVGENKITYGNFSSLVVNRLKRAVLGSGYRFASIGLGNLNAIVLNVKFKQWDPGVILEP